MSDPHEPTTGEIIRVGIILFLCALGLLDLLDRLLVHG